MIGILFFGALFGYIFLSKFIIKKVYQKYKTEKAKNIALAIMILIPTWDVILGFPIYAYLCVFESGTKIYKTVDNVEGFYVGEKSISSEPIKPYEGYKYIDYKEKRSGKYYRSYWAEYFYDKEVAGKCVYPPKPNSLSYPYTKIFNEGRCIVKEEITESEVSRWYKKYGRKHLFKITILRFKVYKVIEYTDRETGELLTDAVRVWWQGGWLYGILSSIEVGGGISCDGNLDFDKLLEETLELKKQEEK